MRLSKRINQQTRLLAVSYGLLLILSALSRLNPASLFLDKLLDVLVASVYLAAVLGWGVAMYRKVMQKRIRDCLIASCVCMTFWLIIRNIKYYVVSDPAWTRLLWYLFYAAFLFLPLIGLVAALYVGTTESYKAPKARFSAHIVTVLLFLLVLTNDHHEMVFKFIDAENDKYTYGIGYYMILVWILLMVSAMLGIIYKKCIIEGVKKRIVFPLLVVGIGLLYTFSYIVGLHDILPFKIDVTIMFCALTMSLWESLIQAGFIRANIGYENMFKNATVAAQITDNNYNVFYASKLAKELPAEALYASEKEPVNIDENTRLKNAKIRSGHFLWLEDVSAFNRTLADLSETKKELSESNDILNAEIEIKRKIAAVNMQSNLYDQIAKELTGPISELDLIIKNKGKSPSDFDEILKRASVYGAYIKRRSNLIILGQSSKKIRAEELSLCFKESAKYIEGIGCKVVFEDGLFGLIAVDAAKQAYDRFEEAIKEAVFSSDRLELSAFSENEGIKIGITLFSKEGERRSDILIPGGESA